MSRLRWHTRACIGHGSNSTVHRARLLPSGHPVAVKRLQTADARYLRRLRQEAEVLRGLRHDNIVELVGVREDRRGMHLVMELVEGCTVSRLMDALAPAPAVVLYIARELFTALAYAHEQSIVHRDISPRNVLLSWDGDVKLTDFGLAKPVGCPPTTAGSLRGTMPYVSPEQLHSGVADHRSDLFAAGVLLYELIAGRLPFEGDVMQCVARIVRGAPIPSLREVSPWVSSELDALVMKLLYGDVDQRYQSADDVLADLPEVADGREELVAVMDALRASQRGRAGRRLALAAAMVGVVGVVCAFSMPHLRGDGTISVPAGVATPVHIDHTSARSLSPRFPESPERPSDVSGQPVERIETSAATEPKHSNPVSRPAARKRSRRAQPRRRVYTQELPKRRIYTQEPEPAGGGS